MRRREGSSPLRSQPVSDRRRNRRREIDRSTARPKASRRNFVTVGFASDLVRQGRNATRVQGRSPARKARHREVEASPEEVHRADLAEIAGAEGLEHGRHRYGCPEEARSRHRHRRAARPGPRRTEWRPGFHSACRCNSGVPPRVRTRSTRAHGRRRPTSARAEIEQCVRRWPSDHLMVDQVEAQLDPARSIRDEPGREAASIGIEGRVPRMVHPRRAGKPIFPYDLGIKMQRGTGTAPRTIRNVRPPFLDALVHRPSLNAAASIKDPLTPFCQQMACRPAGRLSSTGCHDDELNSPMRDFADCKEDGTNDEGMVVLFPAAYLGRNRPLWLAPWLASSGLRLKQSAKPPASFATLALWRTFRDGGLSPPRFAELSFRRATMLSSDELRRKGDGLETVRRRIDHGDRRGDEAERQRDHHHSASRLGRSSDEARRHLSLVAKKKRRSRDGVDRPGLRFAGLSYSAMRLGPTLV